MRRSVLTILVGAAVVATSCTSKRDSAASTDRPSGGAASAVQKRAPIHPAACSLLSQEEMATILGGPVAAPQGKDGADTTNCHYSPAAENAISPYAQVDIDWDAGEEAMIGTRLAAKMLGKDAGMSVSAPIEGLGDEASSMIGGVTNVRKGRTFIIITLGMQSHSKEKGIAIAKAVLSRLGA